MPYDPTIEHKSLSGPRSITIFYRKPFLLSQGFREREIPLFDCRLDKILKFPLSCRHLRDCGDVQRHHERHGDGVEFPPPNASLPTRSSRPFHR